MPGKKFTLWQVLGWMFRSVFGTKYKTIEDAEIYDYVARRFFGREELAEVIAARLRYHVQCDPDKTLIAERAAGTGIVTEKLVEAGFHVRAFDISAAQLETLRQRLPTVATFTDDLNSPMLGMLPDVFDGLVQVGANRFMTEEGQLTFMQEAQRTLREGGIFIWPIFPFEIGCWWKPSCWRVRVLMKTLHQVWFRHVHREFFYHYLSPFSMCWILIAKK